MKTLSNNNSTMTKKMKKLVALALLCSQGFMSIKAMAPAENQENRTQAEQAAQDEPVTQTTRGQRRSHSTAFGDEHEDVRPALRPRLSDLYEINYDLGSEEIFFNEHVFFFTTIENIAQNPDNLISPETLKQSINQILSLSSITKSHRSYLDKLLANYSNDEQDQAPRGIKVMRYILTQGNPQAKSEILSINSFRQACSLLKLLNEINALTDEQIREGNSMNNNRPLGQLYFQILNSTSRIAVTKFFDKVKAAFADDPAGLQQALTQQDNRFGLTPLHRATFRTNPEAVRAIINALQQAFSGNQEGLRRALTRQDIFTPLQLAAGTNNLEAVRAIINALQQAFADDQERLLRALTQQDNDGVTPLQNAALYNNPEAVNAIINALQQAFAGNQEGLRRALTQQNNDGATPLHYATEIDNLEVAAILQHAVDEAQAAIDAQ